MDIARLEAEIAEEEEEKEEHMARDTLRLLIEARDLIIIVALGFVMNELGVSSCVASVDSEMRKSECGRVEVETTANFVY